MGIRSGLKVAQARGDKAKPLSKNKMAKGRPGTAEGAVSKSVKMARIFYNGS
jgi:hypothetical protein